MSSTTYIEPITGIPSYDTIGGTGDYDPGYTVSADGTIATYTLGASDLITISSADSFVCGVDITSSSDFSEIDSSGTISITVTREVPSSGTTLGYAIGIYASDQSVVLNAPATISVTDDNSYTQRIDGTIYGNAYDLWADGSGTITINGDTNLYASTAGYGKVIYLTGNSSKIIINGNLTASSYSNSTDYAIDTNAVGRLSVSGNTTLTAYGVWPSDNVNGIWNEGVSSGEFFSGNLDLIAVANGSTVAGIRNNGIVYVGGATTISATGNRSAVGIWAQNALSEDYYAGAVSITVWGGLATFGPTYGVFNAGYSGDGAWGYMSFYSTLDITATNGTFEGSYDVYGIYNSGEFNLFDNSGTDVITVTGQKIETGDTIAYTAYGIYNADATNDGFCYMSIANSVDITVSEDVDDGQTSYSSGLGWTYGIYNTGILTIDGGLTIATGSLSAASADYGIASLSDGSMNATATINKSGSETVEIAGDIITNTDGSYAGTVNLVLDTSDSFLQGLVTSSAGTSVGQANLTFTNGAQWDITGGGGTEGSDFGTGTLLLGSGGIISTADEWGTFSASSISDYSFTTLNIDSTTLDSGAVSLDSGASFDLLSDIGGTSADELVFGAGVANFSAGTIDIALAYDPLLSSLASSGTVTAGTVFDAASSIVIADASGADGAFSAVQGETETWSLADGLGYFEYAPIVATTDNQKKIILEGISIVSDVLCFCSGTRIATPEGEKNIENLRAGDLVLTSTGPQRVKFIGQSHYDGRFIGANGKMLPVCITAGALAPNVPSRDLHVSPGHCLLIDGFLVPAGRLVNDINIVQAQRVELLSYYHIELEQHGIVYAENCPAESFYAAEELPPFHNEAEFAALYPEGRRPEPRCAELIEGGHKLLRAEQRILARAQSLVKGYVDIPRAGECFTDERGEWRFIEVHGWAQYLPPALAAQPVEVKIALGRHRVKVLANYARDDLAKAGIGNGRHAFRATLLAQADTQLHHLTVCAVLNGQKLAFTENAKAALSTAPSRAA
jgi:hypothetical protein